MNIKNLNSNFGHVFNTYSFTGSDSVIYNVFIVSDADASTLTDYLDGLFCRGFVAIYGNGVQVPLCKAVVSGDDVKIYTDPGSSQTLSKFTVDNVTFWGQSAGNN